MVISYVSRIAAEKNVDYLADALAIVASRRPDVRILLVGDGPSRPALEQRIGSFAHFAGYLQGEKLSDHYAASDIFAFSSLTETFGNVVLEAMASGLPVVAAPGRWCRRDRSDREERDPRRAVGAPRKLRLGLLGLIDDPEQRTEMALAAREYALSQSWDAIMGGLRERYQRVIDEPTASIRGVPAAR